MTDKEHKDLITHYFDNEANHIPLLIEFLSSGKQANKHMFYSNLFNFIAEFDKNEVILEDECGLFLISNPERSQKVSIDKLLSLCNKMIRKNNVRKH